MKYIVLVQTKNGQRLVQVEAPKVSLYLTLLKGIDSLKNLLK
ncbi:hypothetical protein [Maribacter spongiicola]|nr:hypothetical protein [Maribacter spongiicola]